MEGGVYRPAGVYIRRGKGSHWCETYPQQQIAEKLQIDTARSHLDKKDISNYLLTPFSSNDHLHIFGDNRRPRASQGKGHIICICFVLFFYLPTLTWIDRLEINLTIMLNNMDLNSKDSFYPQFENCNGSSLGMENSARKDTQEMFSDAERGAPAQFTHGKFAVACCCIA